MQAQLIALILVPIRPPIKSRSTFVVTGVTAGLGAGGSAGLGAGAGAGATLPFFDLDSGTIEVTFFIVFFVFFSVDRISCGGFRP
jgi:hypothetical protein